MAEKTKDKEMDGINFEKTRIDPLFQSLFYPTLLSMVFASLFTVADGIFVGQGVGSNALAAINIVAPLFLITTGIALMFGAGVSVVASIHLAQNDSRTANTYITQAFAVATSLMVIVTLAVFLFRVPFLRLLGSSDVLLPFCQDYLLAILPGCICIVIQLIGTFVIRLDGSPKFAASLEIFPGLLNIFLDWLFVFPLQTGIAGVGIASSISCASAAAMVVWYMFFRSKTVKLLRLAFSRDDWATAARQVADMARSGFPSMLGELTMSVMLLTGNCVFLRELGEDGVAAFSVACYLYPIVFMVNNAVVQSAQPIISFNYGSGNRYRVQRAFRVSFGTATVCGVMATAFLTLCAKPLAGLFLHAGTKAYDLAVSGLPLFAYSAVFFAMNVAIIGYHQATARNTRATIYMLLRGLVFLVPAFILMPVFVFPHGLWLAVPVAECLTLGVILLTNRRIISR